MPKAQIRGVGVATTSVLASPPAAPEAVAVRTDAMDMAQAMMATGATLTEVAEALAGTFSATDILKAVLGHAVGAKGLEDLPNAVEAATKELVLKDLDAVRTVLTESKVDPMIATFFTGGAAKGVGKALLADRGTMNPERAFSVWNKAGARRNRALDESRDASIDLLWSLTASFAAAYPTFVGLRIEEAYSINAPELKVQDIYLLLGDDDPFEGGTDLRELVEGSGNVGMTEECHFRDAAWMIFDHPNEEASSYWFLKEKMPSGPNDEKWWPASLVKDET